MLLTGEDAGEGSERADRRTQQRLREDAGEGSECAERKSQQLLFRTLRDTEQLGCCSGGHLYLCTIARNDYWPPSLRRHKLYLCSEPFRVKVFIMEASRVCHFCTVSSVELQPLGEEGLFSCGICRALDRIRGVCWRPPRDCDQHSLAVLRETEGRLRDWIGFNAPPPYEVPGYRPESRGGVVSSLLPAKPKPAPKPSAKASAPLLVLDPKGVVARRHPLWKSLPARNGISRIGAPAAQSGKTCPGAWGTLAPTLPSKRRSSARTTTTSWSEDWCFNLDCFSLRGLFVYVSARDTQKARISTSKVC